MSASARALGATRPRVELDVPGFLQPDDVTCGPTCLHNVARFYGDDRPLEQVIATTRRNPDGGTLGVYLGLAALDRGYRARLYPLGVKVFDPTWWRLPHEALWERLRRRAELVGDDGHIAAWVEFLVRGGQVAFFELTEGLLARMLDHGRPVICGLSSTWLYRQVRERPDDNRDDDVGGQPVGHFVVVCGYSAWGKHFLVRDPGTNVPLSRTGLYVVPGRRLLNAILLGDATRDAVLVEVWPRSGSGNP